MNSVLRRIREGTEMEECLDKSCRSIWLRFSSDTGKAIEGMSLDMSKMNSIKLNPDTFLKMHKLRFLDFFPSSKMKQPYFPHSGSSPLSTYYCKRSKVESDMNFMQVYPFSTFYCWRSLYKELFEFDNCTCSYCSADEKNENKVLAFEGLEFVSTELTFIRWFGFPLKSLPSNSDFVNLVALVMPRSNIEQLGTGIQRFDRLKHINLSHSKQLTRILDLSLCPDLESLILEGCSNLIEVPSSIQYLKRLVILNLSGCKSLSTLPTSIQSESLEHVFLSGCSNLKMASKISGSMKSVFLDGTAIKELPIEFPSRLYQLNLENRSRLESLPSMPPWRARLRRTAAVIAKPVFRGLDKKKQKMWEGQEEEEEEKKEEEEEEEEQPQPQEIEILEVL